LGTSVGWVLIEVVLVKKNSTCQPREDNFVPPSIEKFGSNLVAKGKKVVVDPYVDPPTTQYWGEVVMGSL
jgi:hypothetical protein